MTLPPNAKAVAPGTSHADDCKGPRVERFTVLDPGGSEVTVTRCQECGAQTTK